MDTATGAGAAVPGATSRARVLLLSSAIVFSYLFASTAWVVDDAYITFRTIDNFLAGHGLTWNIGERVQAYTHPLWMFLLSAVIAVTREYFYTSLAVSYVVAVTALLLALKFLSDSDFRRPIAFLLLVVTSKSIIDYSSSGLENPLAYVFAVLFYERYLRNAGEGGPAFRTSTCLWLTATLSYLTRQDTILLYGPPLAHVLWRDCRANGLRGLGPVLVTVSPAIGWLLFSSIYYGFPYPNTAAAKMFVGELSLLQRVERASVYFMLTAIWDALGFIAIAWASLTAWRRREWRPLFGLLGIVLYLGYVLVTGSAATHMVGRFFAVPFFIGFLIAVRLVKPGALHGGLAAVIVAYALVNPVSPWKFNTALYQTLPRSLHGYIDTAWFAHREGTGLRRPSGKPVSNVCLQDGERFRASPEVVRVGGCGGGDLIGFFAFAAGPEKWIVDPLALPDPLLARLRPCVDFTNDQWRPGHFRREIPAGYLESIRSRRNEIVDPGVHEYYRVLQQIVSGPVWSLPRLRSILLMNAGRYDRLLEGYNSEAGYRARLGRCRS